MMTQFTEIYYQIYGVPKSVHYELLCCMCAALSALVDFRINATKSQAILANPIFPLNLLRKPITYVE